MAEDGVGGGVEGEEVADELQLGVAQGVGVEALRAFHGGEAEYLHDVVLHHVAQRADAVVELAARFDAEGFGKGDLHGADVVPVPQGLEEAVAETQGEEVVQAVFAEVVVDAQDLAFLEILRHAVVDEAAGREVGAQRFFEDDAGVCAVEAVCGEAAAGGDEELGGGGKVEDNAFAVGFAVYFGGEGGEVLRVADVQRQVVDSLAEGVPFGGCGGGVGAGFCCGFGEELSAGQAAAACAEDAPLRMQPAGGVGVVEGGQEFAHGQIAGCAEEDKVEVFLFGLHGFGDGSDERRGHATRGGGGLSMRRSGWGFTNSAKTLKSAASRLVFSIFGNKKWISHKNRKFYAG